MNNCKKLILASMSILLLLSAIQSGFSQPTTNCETCYDEQLEKNSRTLQFINADGCAKNVGVTGDYSSLLANIATILTANGHTVTFPATIPADLPNLDVLFAYRTINADLITHAAAIEAWIEAGGILITEFSATNTVGTDPAFQNLCKLGNLVNGFYAPSGTACGGNDVVVNPAHPMSSGLTPGWTCSGDPLGAIWLYDSYGGMNIAATIDNYPIVGTCCYGKGAWVAFFSDFGDFSNLQDPRSCGPPIYCYRTIEDEILLNNAVCFGDDACRSEISCDCNKLVFKNDPGTCEADIPCELIVSCFDANGDSTGITYTCDPSGPYPVGTTDVLVTVSKEGSPDTQIRCQVTVKDTEAPVITVCEDKVVECDGYGNKDEYDAWIEGILNSISDNCAIDESKTELLEYTKKGCGETYTTKISLTVFDVSGNSTTCESTFKVVDTTPPTIHCNTGDGVITPSEIQDGLVITATAEDECCLESVNIIHAECYSIHGKDKIIDKKKPCKFEVVGDSIIIHNSGGVGTTFVWIAEAVDCCGNKTTQKCSITIVKPGNEDKKE